MFELDTNHGFEKARKLVDFTFFCPCAIVLSQQQTGFTGKQFDLFFRGSNVDGSGFFQIFLSFSLKIDEHSLWDRLSAGERATFGRYESNRRIPKHWGSRVHKRPARPKCYSDGVRKLSIESVCGLPNLTAFRYTPCLQAGKELRTSAYKIWIENIQGRAGIYSIMYSCDDFIG